MFGFNCCNCGSVTGLACFGISRQITGFAEYIISHDTDNPVTYFTGRRYMQAEFVGTVSVTTLNGTCQGGAVTLDCFAPPSPPNGCTGWSFTRVQNYTLYTSVPTQSVTGTDHDGTRAAEDFETDGFYARYIEDFGFGSDYGLGYAQDFQFGYLPARSMAGMMLFALQNLLDHDACPGGGWGDTFVDYLIADGLDGANCFDCGASSPEAPGATCGQSIAGTAPSITHNELNSSSFNATGGGDVEAVACDCFCDNCITVTCVPGWTINLAYNSTAEANLTSELDYDSHHDTVYNALTTLQGGSPVSGASYSFNDWIMGTDNYTDDFSGRDGSVLDHGGIQGCGEFFFGIFLPAAATYYVPGGEDTPGSTNPGTYLVAYATKINIPSGTTYIWATFIMMNDGTSVLDSCADGTTTGDVWIPQPNAKSLPNTYGTAVVDGETVLTGPIGRVTCIITGTTCADWDGSPPT